MPLFPRLAALAMLLAAPLPALAHAILESSQPKSGGTVTAGELTLAFTFNSRIDRPRSRLTLTRPDQSKLTLPIDQSGPPEILTTHATLKPGRYVVRWQVLAVDGHITRGDVAFTVTGN